MQALVADLVRAHHPGVLLVTHDVEEAILLARPRPGSADGSPLCFDTPVGLPRPPAGRGSQFDELRARLLGELGVVDPHRGTPLDDIAPLPRPGGSVPAGNGSAPRLRAAGRGRGPAPRSQAP